MIRPIILGGLFYIVATTCFWSPILDCFIMEFVGSNSGRKFSEFCVRACRVIF